MRKRQKSVDRLIPVAERTFAEVAIQSLDHGRARERVRTREAELGPEAKELTALRRAGRAIRVGPTLHYHPEALAEAERHVRALAQKNGEVTIADLRANEIVGGS